MIRHLNRAFVNCPACDTLKCYIHRSPRDSILRPKVTARRRRHESLKIIFYQYAESDGTVHYEFRTRRRRFLSLGLTKLHTRPAPLSIMPPTQGEQLRTPAGGASELCVRELSIRPSPFPFFASMLW